jgi:hypothetical protein
MDNRPQVMLDVRQRTGVRRQGRAGMDCGCGCQDRLHRAGQPLGERSPPVEVAAAPDYIHLIADSSCPGLVDK